ncbi:hypothetical protein TRAPUB_3426 [Trametes pubescens]|uniref:Elongation of fatty acids protein n=1 Tax=Trametes pubescens TaxID=154538 RepID=A0A1M2W7K3_TRAPU|nr:hypothetical protein TRAPUB_3426 [Trametes pubescens]
MAPLADFLLSRLHLASIKLPYELTHYVPGKTLMSTPQEVFPTLVAYLVIIFSIQAWMKNRPAYKLQFLFRVHNAFLSSGSLLLVLCMLEEVIPKYIEHGTFWALCHDEMWTSRLEFYYMINYYFKYIELIDTVFLALKKKPLDYYYYATAGGARIWWKKYLTSFQIGQFIIDLFVVYFATYSYYAANYFPNLPNLGSCAGTETAAVFGCVLLSSYLLLFIQFYIATYKKPAGKKAVANGKANGAANGLKTE